MNNNISLEVILLGLANLGTIVWMAKTNYVMTQRHNEILPHLVAVAESVEKQLPILYERDNAVSARVTRLEQTHQIKGCDKPAGATA